MTGRGRRGHRRRNPGEKEQEGTEKKEEKKEQEGVGEVSAGSSQEEGHFSLGTIVVHYTTLHYTTLHYSTLHYSIQ